MRCVFNRLRCLVAVRAFVALSIVVGGCSGLAAQEAKSGAVAEAEQEGDRGVKEILQKWRDREARFTSGRFLTREKTFLPRGTTMGGYGGGPLVRLADDTVHVSTHTFTFSGGKFRFEHEHPGWSSSENKFVARPYVDTWNGEVGYSLAQNGIDAVVPNQGGLHARRPMAFGESRVSHYLNHYRHSYVSPGLPLEKYTRTGVAKTEDGRECAVFRLDRGNVGRFEVLIDLVRDTSIVRKLRYWGKEGRIIERTDIRYRDDPKHGWVLASWHRKEFTVDGKEGRTDTATVIEARFNDPVDDNEFELTFPKKSLVFDQREPGKQKLYVVQEDGTERAISPRDLRAPAAPSDD